MSEGEEGPFGVVFRPGVPKTFQWAGVVGKKTVYVGEDEQDARDWTKNINAAIAKDYVPKHKADLLADAVELELKGSECYCRDPRSEDYRPELDPCSSCQMREALAEFRKEGEG